MMLNHPSQLIEWVQKMQKTLYSIRNNKLNIRNIKKYKFHFPENCLPADDCMGQGAIICISEN